MDWVVCVVLIENIAVGRNHLGQYDLSEDGNAGIYQQNCDANGPSLTVAGVVYRCLQISYGDYSLGWRVVKE